MHLHVDQYGTKVRLKEGMFLFIKDGEENKIAPPKVETISLAPHTSISSEAIRTALKEGIPVYFLDKVGKPEGQVWSYQYGSIATIRKHQALFPFTMDSVERIRSMLQAKLTFQAKMLRHLFRNHSGKQRMIGEASGKLEEQAQQLLETPVDHPREMREKFQGIEGTAGRTYFQTLGQTLPSPFRFDKRTRRPAADPFNSVLNYLYGMLYGKVEHTLIVAGLDPYLGIYHRDEYNRPSLVFDMIEPFRVWADAVAVRLCVEQVLEEELFDKKDNGYWLGRDGKEVVVPIFHEFLEKEVMRNGRRCSRENHIQQEAHDLARYLLEDFKPSAIGGAH